MRLIFAGTPAFAAVQLLALRAAGHEIVSVLTQPDRPAGRGRRLTTGAVKQAALAAGIDVLQPATLKDEWLQARLADSAVDAWVVAAYGLILPKAVLSAPKFGCINIHASLLPRWRGAAPIQRAIMAGDRETGVSIMQMDEGLDTGPVYLQRAIAILPDDTAGSLHDRLAELGAALICEALARLEQGSIVPAAQDSSRASYAPKIAPQDTHVDWNGGAQSVARMIRALDPAPGAQARIKGQLVKLWSARAHDTESGRPPGTVLAVDADGIHIACAQGALIVTELQRSGGKRLPAPEFVRGFELRAGERFES